MRGLGGGEGGWVCWLGCRVLDMIMDTGGWKYTMAACGCRKKGYKRAARQLY